MIFEADTNLAVGVSGDCEASLTLDILFGEVDISHECGVDDFNVDALVRTRRDVGGDNDKGVHMDGVPNAFLDWDSCGWNGKFDGGGKWEEEDEGKEEAEVSGQEHELA